MRVAIVGSGVSGLSALWMLKQYSGHEVNIYEKNSYPGGHAHSVEVRRDGKEPCYVDTGFTSFNPASAPNLLRFLKLLGVPLVKADRSLSVTRDGRYRWSTGSVGSLLSLTKIFNPRTWRTSLDALRFSYFALDLVLDSKENDDEITIGQYLAREGYSRAFFEDYLLPLMSVIWLVPDDHTALNMPANVVISALTDNALMRDPKPAAWMSIKGGSKTYVDAIVSIVPPENLHLNTEIVAISSLEHGVKLIEASGAEHIYDHVILATPANVTLTMLERGGWASELERKVLSAHQWARVETEVHWDNKGVTHGAAVNYSTSPAPPAYDPSAPARTQQVSITVDMNKIMHLSQQTHGPVRMTVNPVWPVEESSPRYVFSVPYMTWSTTARLHDLPQIQNTRRISYVGAWTRRGRHEDGLSSSMALVMAPPFNAVAPFAFEDNDNETNTTRVTTCDGADRVTVVKTKPSAHWARGIAVLRAGIMSAEMIRRWLSPYWKWLVWPIVLSLAVAQASARLGGWKRLEGVVREFSRGWKGAE